MLRKLGGGVGGGRERIAAFLCTSDLWLQTWRVRRLVDGFFPLSLPADTFLLQRGGGRPIRVVLDDLRVVPLPIVFDFLQNLDSVWIHQIPPGLPQRLGHKVNEHNLETRYETFHLCYNLLLQSLHRDKEPSGFEVQNYPNPLFRMPQPNQLCQMAIFVANYRISLPFIAQHVIDKKLVLSLTRLSFQLVRFRPYRNLPIHRKWVS